MPKTEVRSFAAVGRVLAAAGRNRKMLFLAVFIAWIIAFVNIATSHTLRKLFDSVLAPEMKHAWLLLGTVGGLVLAEIPLAYLRTRVSGSFCEKTLAAVRSTLARKVAFLPVGDFEKHHSGDVLSVMTNDLAQLRTMTQVDLVEIPAQIMLACASLVYLLILNWRLTLVSTILTPVLFLGVSVITGALTRANAKMQEDIGRLNSVAQDALSGLTVARAFNLAGVLDERFQRSNGSVVRRGRRIARLNSITTVISFAAQMSPFLIIFGYGGYLVVKGQMTPGGVVAFINLMNNLTTPLARLPHHFASLGEASGAAGRVFALCDRASERADGSVPEAIKGVPALAFQNVSFRHESGIEVLSGLSLEINAGEKVAIVGPSGSGKTTLVKLALGFYPVSGGRLLLLGHDLGEWSVEEARRRMALVAQDTYLFPGTIAENIALGRPCADREAIEEAARVADIHDTILAFPEGYDTTVGERGARLSGGQRQRIAIARAVLRDAPILLLDEATSALDSESEALVKEALDRVTAGRTTLVIAHRLSTIIDADRIAVLDGGRIVEIGTHEQLLLAGGSYSRLYHTQLREEEAEAGESVRGECIA